MKMQAKAAIVTLACAIGGAACAKSSTSTPPQNPSSTTTLTAGQAQPTDASWNKAFDPNAGRDPVPLGDAPGIQTSDDISAVQHHFMVTPAAAKQGTSTSELAITAGIRRQIMNDATLSFDAKNVSVVTQGTTVVLRGRVANAREKGVIESFAKGESGVSTIDDEIETK